MRVAEQRPANGRRVEVGDVEVDKVFRGMRQPGFVHASAIGAGKQLFNLGIAEFEVANHAFTQQLLEAEPFKHIGRHAGCRAAAFAAGKPQLGACHLERRIENALIDDAHRRRGLRDAIEDDLITALLAAAVAVALRIQGNQELLLDVVVAVLGNEFTQRRFAQSAQENRLMLMQQFDIEEIALAVDADQEIHRRPLEAGDRRQVNRLKGISHRAAFRLEFAGQRPGGQVAELFLNV